MDDNTKMQELLQQQKSVNECRDLIEKALLDDEYDGWLDVYNSSILIDVLGHKLKLEYDYYLVSDILNTALEQIENKKLELNCSIDSTSL